MRTNEFTQTLPPSVNWHFWPWCNYGCKFCFARFEDIPRADKLEKNIALGIEDKLIDIELSVFPNPSSGRVVVSSDLEIIQINLYAADGKLISINDI